MRLVWGAERRVSAAPGQSDEDENTMMGSNGIFGGSMMAGAGLIWLLILAVLALGIAALIKYLRS